MQRKEAHVLSHAAVYLLARGLPGIVAFLAIPLFSRLLEPAEYGRLALVVATVELLNALLFQWLRLSLVRFLPGTKDDPAKLKSTLATVACLMVLALGVVAAAVCLVPAAADWRPVVVICWTLLTAQVAFDLSAEHTRAVLRPLHYAGLMFARSGGTILLGTALVLLGADWWGPLAGTAAGMAVAVAFAFRRHWGDARLAIDRALLARICRYGLPLSLTVALAVVITSCDRFLLAWFMGEGAAGLYAVAFDLATQTLTLLMLVINLAVFPLAVRAFEHHGRVAAQEQMRSNASLLLAVGVPCVLGLTVLAPGVAHCFLGEGFRATAAGIIPLVALGAFLAGLKAYHFDAAFQFAHQTIHQVWIVLVAAAANVALNLVAVPRWGINGAAGASVAAFLLSIALTVVVGRRHFVLPFPFGAAARVLLAGGVMAALLYPFRDHLAPYALAAQIAGGAAVYALVLVATNFLGLRDALLRRWVRAAGPIGNDAPPAQAAATTAAGAGSGMVVAVAAPLVEPG